MSKKTIAELTHEKQWQSRDSLWEIAAVLSAAREACNHASRLGPSIHGKICLQYGTPLYGQINALNKRVADIIFELKKLEYEYRDAGEACIGSSDICETKY